MDEEVENSEENPPNKYWLRSRPGKSCERMIQDLISQDSDSDSESGEEVSISWEAPHSANMSHHLHEHPNVEQGQAIRNYDLEITAGQGENTRNLNADEIEIRDSVNDVFSEINIADNFERTEPCNLNGNEKEFESSGINRSPYALRTRKK